MRRLLFLFVLFSSVVSTKVEERRSVTITRLGVAPWLGPLPTLEALANGIARERENLISFISYDLQHVGVEISFSEAAAVVSAMETAARRGEVREIIIPDGTRFLSMGWKSRRDNRIWRTPNPILQLGRDTSGYALTAEIPLLTSLWKVEYIFLRECGNLSLKRVKQLPSEAEEVRREMMTPSTPSLTSVTREIIREREVIREVPRPVETRRPRFYMALAYGATIYAEADDDARDPSAIGRWGIGVGLSADGAAAGAAAAMMGDLYGWTIGVGLGKRLIYFTEYLSLVGGVGVAHSFHIQKTSGGVSLGFVLSWPPAISSSGGLRPDWWGIGIRYGGEKPSITPPTVRTR